MPPRTITKDDLGVTDLKEIEADFPAEGVPVTIYHKIFWYGVQSPDRLNPDGPPLRGQAFARRGDQVTVIYPEDYARGVQHGAFYHPDQLTDEGAPVEEAPVSTGPGDSAADPELVVFVSEHNVDDVLARATDEDMALLLLEAENEYAHNAGKDPRKGVVAGLQEIIDEATGSNP